MTTDAMYPSTTQHYYTRMLELQEKLRKSEEQRAILEEKFNAMLQLTRDSEHERLRLLRHKYHRFLDDHKRRQDRNEDILRNLEHVENRASSLAARTHRLKHYWQQYNPKPKTCAPKSSRRLFEENEEPETKLKMIEQYINSDEFRGMFRDGRKTRDEVLKAVGSYGKPEIVVAPPMEVRDERRVDFGPVALEVEKTPRDGFRSMVGVNELERRSPKEEEDAFDVPLEASKELHVKSNLLAEAQAKMDVRRPEPLTDEREEPIRDDVTDYTSSKELPAEEILAEDSPVEPQQYVTEEPEQNATKDYAHEQSTEDNYETEQSATDGHDMEQNAVDGFGTEQNTADGFGEEKNATDGFAEEENATGGFAEEEIATGGFAAEQNALEGYAPEQNPTDGYELQQNATEGYETQQNAEEGYELQQTTSIEPQQTTMNEPQQTAMNRPQQTATYEPPQTTNESEETAMYEPQQTDTYEPQPTTTYEPQQTATYEPQQTATYEPQQSATYEPQQSATYEPQQTTTYEPQQTATYEPQQSTTYEPQQTTTYDPQQTATYDPQQSAPYEQNPAEAYDPQQYTAENYEPSEYPQYDPTAEAADPNAYDQYQPEQYSEEAPAQEYQYPEGEYQEQQDYQQYDAAYQGDEQNYEAPAEFSEQLGEYDPQYEHPYEEQYSYEQTQEVYPPSQPDEGVAEVPVVENKVQNIGDLLETDSESVKQETKVSNESDFDFSNTETTEK